MLNETEQTHETKITWDSPKVKYIYAPHSTNLNENVKIIPAFSVVSESERDNIQAIREIIDNLVAHLDDDQLEELEFSNTTVVGSLLNTVGLALSLVLVVLLIWRIGADE